MSFMTFFITALLYSWSPVLVDGGRMITLSSVFFGNLLVTVDWIRPFLFFANKIKLVLMLLSLWTVDVKVHSSFFAWENNKQD